jgi:sulfide:quinone oxidoreductase
MTRTPPRIVILGAGFAALTAVRELRKRAPQARLTLVAPRRNSSTCPA